MTNLAPCADTVTKPPLTDLRFRLCKRGLCKVMVPGRAFTHIRAHRLLKIRLYCSSKVLLILLGLLFNIRPKRIGILFEFNKPIDQIAKI